MSQPGSLWITPAGVPFSVRHSVGLDQTALQEALVRFTLSGISAGSDAIPSHSEVEWMDRLADAERRTIRAELELELLRRRISDPDKA